MADTQEATRVRKTYPVVDVKISEVQADVAAGLTRPEIRTKYNLSPTAMKTLFSHPKLKNTRAASVGVNIIDDTAESAPVAEQQDQNPQETVQEAAQEGASEQSFGDY